MIEASPLIEVYKDVRGQFEDMFCLTHKTNRHSPPKMRTTFKKLQRYIKANQANVFIAGREGAHQLMNTTQAGIIKLTQAVEKERQKMIAKAEKQRQLEAEIRGTRVRNEIGDGEPEEYPEFDEIRQQDTEEQTNETEEHLDDRDLFVDDFYPDSSEVGHPESC